MMVAKLLEPVLLNGEHHDDEARRSQLLIMSVLIVIIFIMTSTSPFPEVGRMRRLILLQDLDPGPDSSRKSAEAVSHVRTGPCVSRDRHSQFCLLDNFQPRSLLTA